MSEFTIWRCADCGGQQKPTDICDRCGSKQLHEVIELPEVLTDEDQEIVRRFHRIYYRAKRTWKQTYWLGTRAIKCPLDLWIYQEMLVELRPDVIVESGTGRGGTSHFLACICELIGSGRVISIDVVVRDRPSHPRINYLAGSSIAPETVAAVRESIRPSERVMVILDSDHSMDHVLTELRLYSPLVTQDSYLIVEDTNLSGHPVAPGSDPGPAEAVEAFLFEEEAFVIDRFWEKSLMTQNPGGFLRRVN